MCLCVHNSVTWRMMCAHTHTQLSYESFFYPLNSSLHSSFFFPKFNPFFFSFIHSICFNVHSENFPFCITHCTIRLYHVHFDILLTLKTIIQWYRMFLSDNFHRAFIKWHKIPLISCNTRHTMCTFHFHFIIIITVIIFDVYAFFFMND